MTDTRDPDAPRSGGRRRRWLRLSIVLVTGGYLTWLLATNWDDFTNAALRITGASGPWIVAGIAVEIVAQIAGGLLLRQLLRGAGHQMNTRTAVRLAMAQNAVGMVVPGGPVAGAAFAYRYLRRRGLDSTATLWVLTGANVVSSLVIVAFGLVAYGGTDEWSLISLVLLLAAAVWLALAVRRPALVGLPARAWYTLTALVRRRSRDAVPGRVAELETRLGAVQLSRRDWLYVLVFAAITVAADLTALVFCTRALVRLPARCTSGRVLSARQTRECLNFRQPTLSRIVLVWVAGQATLTLPFIPGGLGPVEAAMTVTFVGGKIRPVIALSAVLLYRLVSYWGVLLVGMIFVWTIRRQRHTTDEPPPP